MGEQVDEGREGHFLIYSLSYGLRCLKSRALWQGGIGAPFWGSPWWKERWPQPLLLCAFFLPLNSFFVLFPVFSNLFYLLFLLFLSDFRSCAFFQTIHICKGCLHFSVSFHLVRLKKHLVADLPRWIFLPGRQMQLESHLCRAGRRAVDLALVLARCFFLNESITDSLYRKFNSGI